MPFGGAKTDRDGDETKFDRWLNYSKPDAFRPTIPVEKEIEVVQFHNFSTAAVCFAQSTQGNIAYVGSSPQLTCDSHKHKQEPDNCLSPIESPLN